MLNSYFAVHPASASFTAGFDKREPRHHQSKAKEVEPKTSFKEMLNRELSKQNN